jgi:uncharacterized damage-inducible protein DinB
MAEDTRPDPPMAAPPVEMLSAFLDFHRATLLCKVEGLTDEQLRRPMVSSGTCLLGIVKHSAYVERWWFSRVFAGDPAELPWSKEDPDADWRIEPTDTTAGILALYQSEIARSREVIQGAAWDDVAKFSPKGHTLGWILTHMVEEVARHNGHADILREQIDGKTGE